MQPSNNKIAFPERHEDPMKAFGCWALIAAVATGIAGQTSELGGRDQRIPELAHTCLITRDVKRLVDFYEPVLEQKAKWSGTEYAEFSAGGNVLAIFSAKAQERYIPGSAE